MTDNAKGALSEVRCSLRCRWAGCTGTNWQYGMCSPCLNRMGLENARAMFNQDGSAK